MSSGSGSAPIVDRDDRYDPEILRKSQNLVVVADAVAQGLPVFSSPKKNLWARAHPDPVMSILLNLLVFQSGFTKVYFMVKPELMPELQNDLSRLTLTVAVYRDGSPFLWAVPVGGEIETNGWTNSSKIGVETAKTKWVRMIPINSTGRYEVKAAEGVEPVFPKISMREILKTSFPDDRYIDTLDHPVVRSLTKPAK